ncbi:hypothetical protein MGYG_06739 [Nannizzia gypsea CBS 118893]|uniref:Uncharacterized protein n=1 Tax=Arthroderma gypseum (strain ATCC MYA-4604 / CBS 118893) TaxID=535722 RepID=E4V125_ARTGP|nr:hypothetical protein MGYG_06739 [Nannizzia gypsea CBS 118893]EFR03740.1 hypothetical protein MGYG_06739 [Nannizzia gypsea CBS 118893]
MSDSVFKKPCVPPSKATSRTSTPATDTSSNMSTVTKATQASSAASVSSGCSAPSDPPKSTKEERKQWFTKTMAEFDKMSRKELREMLRKDGRMVGRGPSYDFEEDIEYEQSCMKD